MCRGGDDYDINGSTANSSDNPAQDSPRHGRPGYDNGRVFGSARANGFVAVLYDGSVQLVSYSIVPQIHRRLGHRKDRLPVDAAAIY